MSATHPDEVAATEVPRRHDDITPEWLTAALRSFGLDVTVARFDRRPLGDGRANMAVIEVLDLAYASGDGPASVVVKMSTPNEAHRAVAAAFDLYRREVLFYRDLAARTPARTPVAYFVHMDGAEFGALVLEDLSDYRVGDQVAGCSPADARLCMASLADLHASFWGDVERDELAFVPYHHPSFHSTNLRDGAVAGWDAAAETFGDLVPAALLAAKDEYLAAVPAMQEWIATPPLTVVHGDFRMDNLLFGQGAGHSPVAAVDWQTVLRGRAIHDVAYFLSQSMQVDVRRAHERELLSAWQSGLAAAGVTGYSPEQAWEDYRRAVLYLWIYVVFLTSALDRDNERAVQWMSEMSVRAAAAIEDLDCLPLLGELA